MNHQVTCLVGARTRLSFLQSNVVIKRMGSAIRPRFCPGPIPYQLWEQSNYWTCIKLSFLNCEMEILMKLPHGVIMRIKWGHIPKLFSTVLAVWEEIDQLAATIIIWMRDMAIWVGLIQWNALCILSQTWDQIFILSLNSTAATDKSVLYLSECMSSSVQ